MRDRSEDEVSLAARLTLRNLMAGLSPFARTGDLKVIESKHSAVGVKGIFKAIGEEGFYNAMLWLCETKEFARNL